MKYQKIKKLFYTYAFFDDFILIYPLYGVMFADNGLNPAQISSLFIVWSLVSFILEVPSGAVADKYSRKNVLLFASLIRAFAFLSWLLLPNYLGFLVGFALWGVNSAFCSGTEEALVYDELQRVNRVERYARVTGMMKSLRLISRILGGLAASLLAGSGYILILVCSIASVLLSAVPVSLLPKASPVASTEETKYWEFLREGVGLVLRNTKLLFLIGFAAIVTGLSSVDEYFDLFFNEKGFSNSRIALAIGIVCLLGAIGSAVAHRLETRAIPPTFAIFLGAGLLWASTVVPAGISPVMIGLYVGYISIFTILFDTRMQREIPDKNRATMTSVSGLAIEIFALIAFGLVALSSQLKDYTFSLQVIAVAIGLLAVVYGLLSRLYITKTQSDR